MIVMITLILTLLMRKVLYMTIAIYYASTMFTKIKVSYSEPQFRNLNFQ